MEQGRIKEEGNEIFQSTAEEINQRQRVSFGENSYTQEERENIKSVLQQKLGKDELSQRKGPGGQNLTYLETWKAIDLANEIFGYDGWSSSVISLCQDYLEEGSDGKITCGISAIVRIQLKDGSFHEDVGYGTSTDRNKGTALENAKKGAVSDGLKRALRLFGNHLGNSVYDKEHLKEVNKKPPLPPPASRAGQMPNKPQQ
eukprot:TRINITY_DN5772_c0_g1_i1.p1 TRINITY_DN5772_c0_g1~~TRINITY_DN5772_c0_g1_i1.p1  ORF type:complete len:201 (-),score=62.04 TRINITY_DN5772_c0_g1_i1:23-625(-)